MGLLRRTLQRKRFRVKIHLFVHPITSKVSAFRSITAYNADFQITLDKLRSSGNTLPDDLNLAAYLHVIEESYLDFAAANRSSAQKKFLLCRTLWLSSKMTDKNYSSQLP